MRKETEWRIRHSVSCIRFRLHESFYLRHSAKPVVAHLQPNRRFTHRPILEALFQLQEGGKPEFTSEFY
jgi:hypothetical protein